MAEFENLKLIIENDILTVMINREDKYNALNSKTLDEIHLAIQKAYDDESIKGVIITGAGQKAFVAGADIEELAQVNEMTARKFAEHGQEVFAMIENCYKPVIAAINGFALGGGCELAMACHIRVATENAKFAQPEVKLGVIPGYGGTQRLPQLIGKGKALELMMTGEMISAQEAKNLGLVNYVATDIDALHAKAQDLLRRILKNSPAAVGMVINCVNSIYSSQESGYQTEANYFRMAAKTEDFKEGTSAFLAKREAQFTGK
ncbi:MAG: enoyl-CoA hydratase/isomerase family protein [Thermonemataceae bacterium]